MCRSLPYLASGTMIFTLITLTDLLAVEYNISVRGLLLSSVENLERGIENMAPGIVRTSSCRPEIRYHKRETKSNVKIIYDKSHIQDD